MNNTEEKILYYKSLAEIMYRYLEFTLSFDSSNHYSYLNILPALEDTYADILNYIEQMEELHFNSHEAIEKIEEIILFALSQANIIDIQDIKEGLSIEDISNLSIAFYLKRYKISLNDEINSILDILSKYNTSEAKFLTELINMFKNTVLSTSITSTTIDDKLMAYYANKLRISYNECSTAKMYTFIMLNTILGLNEALSRFLESVGLTDVQLRDVAGHLDCFNSHKDDVNAIYPIDDLAGSLTNLHNNINTFNHLLQEKNKIVSLQHDVKSGN